MRRYIASTLYTAPWENFKKHNFAPISSLSHPYLTPISTLHLPCPTPARPLTCPLPTPARRWCGTTCAASGTARPCPSQVPTR